MKHLTFVVVLKKDEEQSEIFNVSVPALPGCFTWGFGKKEALKNAKEAIELYLSVSREDIEVPETAEVEVNA